MRRVVVERTLSYHPDGTDAGRLIDLINAVKTFVISSIRGWKTVSFPSKKLGFVAF